MNGSRFHVNCAELRLTMRRQIR